MNWFKPRFLRNPKLFCGSSAGKFEKGCYNVLYVPAFFVARNFFFFYHQACKGLERAVAGRSVPIALELHLPRTFSLHIACRQVLRSRGVWTASNNKAFLLYISTNRRAVWLAWIWHPEVWALDEPQRSPWTRGWFVQPSELGVVRFLFFGLSVKIKNLVYVKTKS